MKKDINLTYKQADLLRFLNIEGFELKRDKDNNLVGHNDMDNLMSVFVDITSDKFAFAITSREGYIYSDSEDDCDYGAARKFINEHKAFHGKQKVYDDHKMLMSKEDVLKHPFIDQDIKDRIAKETENKPEQLHYEWQGLEPAPDPVYSKSAIKVKHILEVYGTALDDTALDVIENDKEFQIEILSIALESAEGLIKAQSAFIRRNISK